MRIIFPFPNILVFPEGRGQGAVLFVSAQVIVRILDKIVGRPWSTLPVRTSNLVQLRTRQQKVASYLQKSS